MQHKYHSHRMLEWKEASVDLRCHLRGRRYRCKPGPTRQYSFPLPEAKEQINFGLKYPLSRGRGSGIERFNAHVLVSWSLLNEILDFNRAADIPTLNAEDQSDTDNSNPLSRGRGLGRGRPMASRSTILARNLRRKATDAEKALWRLLRNRQLAGCKFRRQVPLE